MRSQRIALSIALACFGLAAGLAVGDFLEGYGASEGEKLALASFGFATFLVAAAFAGAVLSPKPVGERLGLGPGRLTRVEVALLAVGTLALSHALDGVLAITELKAHSILPQFEEELRGLRGPGLALALLAFGGAAGISEEIFCRGFVQRGLALRLPPASAIVLASLVFGAMHVDPVHAGFATVLGLYLGAIAHLAASVRPSILCHIANNLAAVTFAAYQIPQDGLRGGGVVVGFLVAAGALGFVLRRRAADPSCAGVPRSGVTAAPQHSRPDGSLPMDGAPAPRAKRPAAGGELQPGARSDDA
jgi:membrane protease YdiL (CAAX protease family)